MAKTKKSGGESNTALVIALVFFILLSIGMGVMYYLGMETIASATKEKDDAVAKASAAEKAKLQAEARWRVNRLFLGTATDEDKNLLANPSADLLTAAQDEHRTLLAAANNRVAGAAATAGVEGFRPEEIFVWNWPNGASLPPQPSPGVLLDRFAKVIAEKEKAVRDSNLKIANAQAEADKFKKESERYTTVITEAVNKTDAKIEDLKAALEGLAKDKEASLKKYEDDTNRQMRLAEAKGNETRELSAQIIDLNRTIEGLRKQNQQLRERIDAEEANRRGVFAVNVPHGEITKRTGNMVEINIGTSDNLKPGQTFTIQPASTRTEGLASRKRRAYDENGNLVVTDEEVSKGSIEIVEVLGPNLASARITEESDEIRDSILKGDLLYNPLWRKGVADHVVLAGIFDIDADGIDDIGTVARTLTRRGVVVDGYYDLASNKWASLDPNDRKPGPTQNTAYVIRGWLPEATVSDPLISAKADMVTAINAAVVEARDRGATEIKANKFFAQIGYRVSQNISESTVNLAAVKFLKGEITAPMTPPSDR